MTVNQSVKITISEPETTFSKLCMLIVLTTHMSVYMYTDICVASQSPDILRILIPLSLLKTYQGRKTSDISYYLKRATLVYRLLNYCEKALKIWIKVFRQGFTLYVNLSYIGFFLEKRDFAEKNAIAQVLIFMSHMNPL